MKYKGYEITTASQRGGKAGRGRNKTTTLQVREPASGGYLLKKQIRYRVGDAHGYGGALHKAKLWVDARCAEKDHINSKRVRVTVEVDQSFLRLLQANIELTRNVRGWLHRDEDAGDITASQVLGLLVYMEARGGFPEQIGASTPFMWRPNIDVIHDERRVYAGRKLLSGPRFHGETQHCEKHKCDFETAKCPICASPPTGG
jgi:hypothetical protein